LRSPEVRPEVALCLCLLETNGDPPSLFVLGLLGILRFSCDNVGRRSWRTAEKRYTKAERELINIRRGGTKLVTEQVDDSGLTSLIGPCRILINTTILSVGNEGFKPTLKSGSAGSLQKSFPDSSVKSRSENTQN